MAWILAAREEPDSIKDHVLARFGNQLTAEMIDAAAESYDPDWLLAGIIQSDGTGSAHFAGRYNDAPGMILAAVAQDSVDAFDEDTGEPLRELWVEAAGFGSDLADTIRAGRSARSVNITLDQRYPDNDTGPYLGHLALLTPGEQPRIPGMAPLDPALFEDGIEDPAMREQIAASGEGATTRLSISRNLDMEASTMPDEELNAAEEDPKEDTKAAITIEDDEDDEDDEKKGDKPAVSASLSASIAEAVEAAMSKRENKVKPRRSRNELNAAGIAEAMTASLSPLLGRFEQVLNEQSAASAKQEAEAHARELVASLPPGLQDGAVEQLANIADKDQRIAMGEILASAAGVLAPVNLDDLRVPGKSIDPVYIEAAAADFGVSVNDLRGPVRDSVMELAASKAASAKASKELN